jgi:GAF domain-containing protein
VLADYDSKIDGSAITGTIIPVTDDDPVISVVETTKRSIVIPDAKNNPKTMAVRHIMIAKNIECLLVTPLLMRGEMIGTIAVDISDPERVFTPAEVKLAETIAAQLGGFLENTRLFQETQKRAERESMINTINQRIQSATTIEGALETTAREIGHLMKARRTVVEISFTEQNGN